ncbi:MAG TPA: HD domain-containing phosphohydrolase [Bryobacteraceae bacterium]|nr:HD domain-containing phosphohydrolase [Bryobacteraceae bacterium]
MLLYKSWLAISVILILAGTAFIGAGPNTNPYFAFSVLALLAFGLDLADGSNMGFVFILVALPHLAWHDALLLAESATFIHAVTHPERVAPRALLRSLCSIALAILVTQVFFHGRLLAFIPEPLRLMLSSGVCFLALNVLRWNRKNLWSFPYYPVAAAIAALFPASVALVPLLYLTWWSYRLYERRLEQQQKECKKAADLYFRTVETLALAIEAKDQPMVGHSRRVQIYATEMAKELGLEQREIDALMTASLLYDIGELAVPEHIILKPGPLTPEEYEKVKIHPMVAAEILERVKFPYPVAPIVLAHHERWDGKGYPFGLKGTEIPIGARILAAVDTLDAYASPRRHRAAVGMKEALEKVAAESGKAFDPRVVTLLKRNQKQWERRVAAPDHRFIDSIFSAQREAHALFDLTRKLGSSLDLDETFAALSPSLEQLVHLDSFVVWIERDGALHAEYVAGRLASLFSSLKIPMGRGLSGWVAANQKSIINGDAATEMAHLGSSSYMVFPSSVRHTLSVPLSDGGVRGALTLYRNQNPLFTTEDARIAATIAPKLCGAIANSLRFRRANAEAVTDSMTGLPNVAALAMRLEANDSPAAVVVCDLDGFKAVNDQFGHLMGNRLLEALAERFQKSCRAGDFVARLGGDEFVLLLAGVGPDDVGPRIAQFRETVRATGRALCNEDVLDASFGAAFFPADGTTSDALLATADQRMYRLKAEHKNGVLRIKQRQINA